MSSSQQLAIAARQSGPVFCRTSAQPSERPMRIRCTSSVFRSAGRSSGKKTGPDCPRGDGELLRRFNMVVCDPLMGLMVATSLFEESHDAPSARCPLNVESSAELPRKAGHQAQSRRAPADLLQIEAGPVILDMQHERIGVLGQSNLDRGPLSSFGSMLRGIGEQLVEISANGMAVSFGSSASQDSQAISIVLPSDCLALLHTAARKSLVL